MTNRALVGLSLVVLLATTWVAQADDAEEKAQAVLERLGKHWNPQSGRLDLYQSAVSDDDLKDIARLYPIRVLNLNVTKISDHGLAHVAGLKELQTLYLAGTSVTDGGLKHLAKLEQLQSLVLRGTRIDDDGLEQLRHLKNLELLYLEQTHISDDGLKHLSGLFSLRDLNLSGTTIGDAGLAQLKNLKELRTLDLHGTRASVAGLKHLQGLKQLRYRLELPAPAHTPDEKQAIADLRQAGITVEATQLRWRSMAHFDERQPPRAGLTVTAGRLEVTDDALANMAKLPNVQVLLVRTHAITDAGLAHVNSLTSLEEIDLLCMTKITDKGLEHFKGLTNLKRLILDGTSTTDAGLIHLLGLKQLEYVRFGKRVTAAGIREFSEKLPNAKVVHYALGIR